ncbi:MAG: hypothetical protein RTU30_10300 [Candidatus Thorarchaeota archaeon]
MVEMEFSYTDLQGRIKKLKTPIVTYDESTAGVLIEEPTIASIDMRPCAGLKVASKRFVFALRHTHIQKIDLAAFGYATLNGGLDLDLSHNKLEFIDLTRVRGVNPLRVVDLSNNQLSTIEIGSYLSKAESVDLSHNQLVSIDISRFYSSKFHYFDISHNKLEFVDISPLVTCENLNSCNFSGNPNLVAIAITTVRTKISDRVRPWIDVLIRYPLWDKEGIATMTNLKTSETAELGYMRGDYCDSCGSVLRVQSRLYNYNSMWRCRTCFVQAIRRTLEKGRK